LSIGVAHDKFGAWLVQAWIEHEFAAMLESRRCDAPSCNDFGKICDIRLSITRADANGVQFHDLAREILVDAFAAPDSGERIRSDRLDVVEIEQHRRVALDRKQQVRKLAAHMWSDCLTLESTAQGPHLAFVGGNAKVVGPEPNKAFNKADLRLERRVEPSLSLLQINLLRNAGAALGGPRFHLA